MEDVSGRERAGSGERLEERALAGAVAADEAHAIGAADGEREAAGDQAGAGAQLGGDEVRDAGAGRTLVADEDAAADARVGDEGGHALSGADELVAQAAGDAAVAGGGPVRVAGGADAARVGVVAV